MSKKIVAAVIIVMSIAGGVGYHYHEQWRGSPEYALAKVQEAVNAHDVELFRRYVDLDSVLGRGVEAILESVGKEPAATGVENDGGWIEDLTIGFVKIIQPFMVSEGKKGIEHWIETGKWPYLDDSTKAAADQPLGMGKIGQFEYIGITSVKHEGKSAWASLAFRHVKYDAQVTLKLFMRQAPAGHLRVIEIENLAPLVVELWELEKKWRLGQNEPAIKKIEDAIAILKVDKRTSAGRWVLGKKYHLWLQFKNNSEQEIERVEGPLSITVKGESAPLSESMVAFEDMKLAPGDQRLFIWSVDVSVLGDVDQTIYDTPIEELEIKYVVNSMGFKDGKEIELPFP